MNFKEIPTILTSDELVDLAFRKAAKAGSMSISKRGPKYVRVKRSEGQKVKTAARAIQDNFKKILRRTPRMEELSPFYYELIGVIVQIPKLKQALGSLNWVIEASSKLEMRYRYKIRRARKDEEIYRYRKEFYGRLASILRQIDDQLEFLAEAREKLKNLPNIEDEFTIVIAGSPNVGKSTFLRAITSAEPRVNSYPFTTQQILLGYFERNHQRYQVVDTPGLLDRPLEERNPVERHAILALKHLADCIIFLFDPSETCGFVIQDQIAVYKEICNTFDTEVIPVINKADLLKKRDIEKFLEVLGREAFICSAEQKIGVDQIVEKIVEMWLLV